LRWPYLRSLRLTWIGLLDYLNFMQSPFFAQADALGA
jgi:hypothetical protein